MPIEVPSSLRIQAEPGYFGEMYHCGVVASLFRRTRFEPHPQSPPEDWKSAFLQQAGTHEKEVFESNPTDAPSDERRARFWGLRNTAAPIAQAFAADPRKAYLLARVGILGHCQSHLAIQDVMVQRLGACSQDLPKVGLFIRITGNQPYRNTTDEQLSRLVNHFTRLGFQCVLFGAAVPDDWPQTRLLLGSCIDFTQVWTSDAFPPDRVLNRLTAQAAIGFTLFRRHRLEFIVGMKSGSMDGFSFCGIPQVFFCEELNPRMAALSEHIPSFMPAPAVMMLDGARVANRARAAARENPGVSLDLNVEELFSPERVRALTTIAETNRALAFDY